MARISGILKQGLEPEPAKALVQELQHLLLLPRSVHFPAQSEASESVPERVQERRYRAWEPRTDFRIQVAGS